MATHTHPADNRNLPVARIAYGALLVLAVAALLIYALRYAFPSGNTGIEQDAAETAPGQQGPS